MGRKSKVMKAKEFAETIGAACAEGIKAGIENPLKLCGFELKPCTKKCIYYNTCVRNPYRYDQRKG